MKKILFILFIIAFSSEAFSDDKMILGLEVYKNKAMCGTCHIYIKSHDFDKLESKKNDEIMAMESLALELKKHSRLGCQVEFKKEYDNITVTIAPD